MDTWNSHRQNFLAVFFVRCFTLPCLGYSHHSLSQQDNQFYSIEFKVQKTHPLCDILTFFIILLKKNKHRMKFHRFCILAMCATASHAFTTSSNSNRKSLIVRHSTAVHQSTKPWADLHEFNIALDKLAEQCSNSNQPVVARAAECQELWEKQKGIEDDKKITPDTISFNTVLKAWNRCCNTMSESNRHSKVIPSDYKRAVDVYTPRDAATRATSLLFSQEETTTDVASYNIVIGK